jgi:SpoVK/Ycf46/Vps4 family AAA+-type ATPase
MRVFIAWSGDRSKVVAMELRSWLPKIIQSVKPWMSETDIPAGARWLADLTAQLQETSFGIIALTRQNAVAPWIHFEAGALAKQVSEASVCPYLIDIKQESEVVGPLAQFQSKKAVREDTLALVKDVNRALGENKLSEEILVATFERFWPDLDKVIQESANIGTAAVTTRTERELLEEILEGVRSLGRQPSRFSPGLIIDAAPGSGKTLLARSLAEIPLHFSTADYERLNELLSKLLKEDKDAD